MPHPTVSVVIPTYNRAHLVTDAIDSVLGQTYTDYEIIVVDDGSTDGTGELLKAGYGERIRYLRQENRGPAAARNLGVKEAKGEYIAFLDSDDVWVPEKLSECCRSIFAWGGAGAVDMVVHRCVTETAGGGVAAVTQTQDAAFLEYAKDPYLREALVLPGVWQLQGCMVRTEFFKAIGGLREDLFNCDDYEFFPRAWQGAQVVVIDRPLTIYRRLDSGVNQADIRAYACRIRALEAISALGHYSRSLLRHRLCVQHECLGGLMRTSRNWTQAATEYRRAWRLSHSPRLLGKFLVMSAFSALAWLFPGRLS